MRLSNRLGLYKLSPVLIIFYSQLYMNEIEQQAMPIQALSFLHVQGMHSLISV